MKIRPALLAAVAALLSGVCGARAGMIEEISVDSVDMSFDYVASPVTDGELRIEQDGVTVVIEKPGNVQEEVSGALFSLLTYLSVDNSIGGKALGEFQGGTLIIKDALDMVLLSGDINELTMEENTSLPFVSILTGSGSFDVTGGTWESDFGDKGIILDLTWRLGTNVDDFSSDFSAESDVTLVHVPEPSILLLLGFGGLAPLHRKKK